jgi:hypothetical protein
MDTTDEGAGAMIYTTPGNPESNLSPGALGYFAAYSVKTATLNVRR